MDEIFLSLEFFLKQRTCQAHERSAVFRQIPKTYFEIENGSKDLFVLCPYVRRSQFMLRAKVAEHA
jgi:hypothetical protein